MTAATASHHPQLTIAEAAELVGVSRDTIRRMIGRGQLKAYRYGVRVIRIDEADLLPSGTPTPITNADADWLAITTMNPHVAILARETTNAWVTLWGFPIDLSIKSQRLNQTAANKTLYLAWEMSLLDEVSGFTMTGWNCSLDALIRTP